MWVQRRKGKSSWGVDGGTHTELDMGLQSKQKVWAQTFLPIASKGNQRT